MGVHCVTRKTVAVKIINREKLSKSVLMKVVHVCMCECVCVAVMPGSQSVLTISAFCRLTLCLGAIVLSGELFCIEGCWWAGWLLCRGYQPFPMWL